MNSTDRLLDSIGNSSAFSDLCSSSEKRIELRGVCGSLWGVLAALSAYRTGGVHLVVSPDKDSAGYTYNDIYNVLEHYKRAEGHVFLLPTAYKHSVLSMQQDPVLVASRTRALSAVLSGETVVICTWADALGEKVVAKSSFSRHIFTVSTGQQLDMYDFIDRIGQKGFCRVEFVAEPGQYAVRGGIIDIFSFGDSYPYRIEFMDDMVESIRSFKVDTQLSDSRYDAVSIITSNSEEEDGEDCMISLLEYLGEDTTLWCVSPEAVKDHLNATRKSLIEMLSDPSKADALFIGGRSFVDAADRMKQITLSGTMDGRSCRIEFQSRPQPAFNKDFGMLASNIRESAASNIDTYILSESYTQIDRLEDIFRNMDIRVGYKTCLMPLHEGFAMDLFQAYTDHQIFDRFQRYKVFNDIDRPQAMAISELNALKIGDYIVHIDHGIGRFGGLVHTVQNGVEKEFMKISYAEGDVLMLGVASLHKISKYRSGDDVAPVIKRLGSGSWAKTKAIAKSRVKEMARDLIKLYAERKASGGFAYSPDTYLQKELEASFVWEDTPDQLSATEAVKRDMESHEPMDRLICGDVGFGKTEVAIRAAFKAVTDGKQVAVLVPTTILTFQHLRTFSSRLRDFPVVVESLSRVKTAVHAGDTLKRLKEGKIDIIIGTHKLLGKNVEFKDLGLLIIDEEQKFGVKMKEKLRTLRSSVDTLTMTATPIPRTLQFSLLGARDLSIINTPPPNRQPIQTEVQPFSDVIVAEAVRYELRRGGQVFFLHNRVKDIYSVADRVRQAVPEANVAVGHGQMNPDELEKLVLDFIYGEFNVFVCTTIIENGIDIPNANTIIINDAHKFGLSDLHQLRGRVGRGNRKAFCYLLVPSFDILTSDGQRRLRVIEECSELGSGFNIAMQDLDIRGAGNLFGAEQSGFISQMGYETYQKIISEAVEELRIEQGLVSENARTLDCHVETSVEAYLPEDYIGSTTEKIKLYKELDGITSDTQLVELGKKLEDRFGRIPEPARNLMKVVSIRNRAAAMGIEKIIFNPPKAVLYFTEDKSFPFFSTDGFQQLLGRITGSRYKCRLEQKGNRLLLTVNGVKELDKIFDF